MGKAFISHSSRDRGFVEREILPLLHGNNINTWYASDDIDSASQWEREIRFALEACDSLAVTLTGSALASPWVKAEVDWWLEERRDCLFVPVIVEACDWKSLHLLIRNYQAVDFSQGSYDAKRQFLRAWGIEGKEQRGLVRSVFPCYAREDTAEVLRWKMGAEIGGVDVFVDVMSLRAGESWEDRWKEEIEKRDLFCLFWSEAASKSARVREEWEFALSLDRPDFIKPIPIAQPHEAPPPKALRHLHFGNSNRLMIDLLSRSGQ